MKSFGFVYQILWLLVIKIIFVNGGICCGTERGNDSDPFPASHNSDTSIISYTIDFNREPVNGDKKLQFHVQYNDKMGSIFAKIEDMNKRLQLTIDVTQYLNITKQEENEAVIEIDIDCLYNIHQFNEIKQPFIITIDFHGEYSDSFIIQNDVYYKCQCHHHLLPKGIHRGIISLLNSNNKSEISGYLSLLKQLKKAGQLGPITNNINFNIDKENDKIVFDASYQGNIHHLKWFMQINEINDIESIRWIKPDEIRFVNYSNHRVEVVFNISALKNIAVSTFDEILDKKQITRCSLDINIGYNDKNGIVILSDNLTYTLPKSINHQINDEIIIKNQIIYKVSYRGNISNLLWIFQLNGIDDDEAPFDYIEPMEIRPSTDNKHEFMVIFKTSYLIEIAKQLYQENGDEKEEEERKEYEFQIGFEDENGDEILSKPSQILYDIPSKYGGITALLNSNNRSEIDDELLFWLKTIKKMGEKGNITNSINEQVIDNENYQIIYKISYKGNTSNLRWILQVNDSNDIEIKPSEIRLSIDSYHEIVVVFNTLYLFDFVQSLYRDIGKEESDKYKFKIGYDDGNGIIILSEETVVFNNTDHEYQDEEEKEEGSDDDKATRNDSNDITAIHDGITTLLNSNNRSEIDNQLLIWLKSLKNVRENRNITDINDRDDIDDIDDTENVDIMREREESSYTVDRGAVILHSDDRDDIETVTRGKSGKTVRFSESTLLRDEERKAALIHHRPIPRLMILNGSILDDDDDNNNNNNNSSSSRYLFIISGIIIVIGLVSAYCCCIKKREIEIINKTSN